MDDKSKGELRLTEEVAQIVPTVFQTTCGVEDERVLFWGADVFLPPGAFRVDAAKGSPSAAAKSEDQSRDNGQDAEHDGAED